jgi:hypothetical protein
MLRPGQSVGSSKGSLVPPLGHPSFRLELHHKGLNELRAMLPFLKANAHQLLGVNVPHKRAEDDLEGALRFLAKELPGVDVCCHWRYAQAAEPPGLRCEDELRVHQHSIFDEVQLVNGFGRRMPASPRQCCKRNYNLHPKTNARKGSSKGTCECNYPLNMSCVTCSHPLNMFLVLSAEASVKLLPRLRKDGALGCTQLQESAIGCQRRRPGGIRLVGLTAAVRCLQ